MTMQELLPCAHCSGSTGLSTEAAGMTGTPGYFQVISCQKCGVGIKRYIITEADRDGLFAAWNTRAQPAGGEAWRPIETYMPGDRDKPSKPVLTLRGKFNLCSVAVYTDAKPDDPSHWRFQDDGDAYLINVHSWMPIPDPSIRAQAQKPAEETSRETE